MEVSRSIDLPCGRQEAWDLLSDWEVQARWMLDADEVRVVGSQRTGVGVRLVVRTRIAQIPAFTEPMEVTGWDPPRSLVIQHGGPVSGVGTWLLEPAGPGATRFTWTEQVRLDVPIIGEIAARWYRPIMERLISRALGGVRRAVIDRGPA
jgi:carbon monoxide dehydrogenase subunit G